VGFVTQFIENRRDRQSGI